MKEVIFVILIIPFFCGFSRDGGLSGASDNGSDTVSVCYAGVVPGDSCEGDVSIMLNIRHLTYSGDGRYTLIRRVLGCVKDSVEMGRRYTLRGMPGDDNATLWELRSDDGGVSSYWLVESDSTLVMLNQEQKLIDKDQNYKLLNLNRL